MHKFLFFLLVVFVAAYFLISNRQIKQSLNPSSTPITENKSVPIEMVFNDQTYLVYLEKIEEPGNVRLIPNFAEQKSSSVIKQENSCQSLFSGQFYTTNHKPLGFLQIRYNIISQIHNQAFLNGFVVSQNGKLFIAEEIPNELVGFAFQAGPIITPDIKLNISNDEPARRILLGQTKNGDFYFLAITDNENSFSGPLLKDLPEILNKTNSDQFIIHNSKFIILINLDGGTASVFINDSVNLTELAPVGSFLCAS